MPLTDRAAEEVASKLYEMRNKDRKRLETINKYAEGKPDLMWLPFSAAREMQALAQSSRVNMMQLVINSTAQQMFVDGYTTDDPDSAELVWGVWQRNRWDRKQIGVHRAAAKYGVAYGTVLPGTNDIPVLRPHSPMTMTAAYGSNDDWAEYALEERGNGVWRLYDSECVYELRRSTRRTSVSAAGRQTITFEMVPDSVQVHGQDVTPVVRYVADEDLDTPIVGDVEPLFHLQDQLNIITFHLMVAEHYGAHGRRVLIGRMVKELEAQLQRNSANTMMTINADPTSVNVEEFSQTQLDGFLASRESSIRMISAISQTPTHELLGSLANMSAAALVESRESTARKVAERQIVLGEAHEQLLGQAGTLVGVDLDPMARIRWKPRIDQRSMQLVELLGTVADRLNVPREVLWEHLPFSSADIAEMRKAAESSDSGS